MEFIAKIPDNLPEIIENNGEEVKAWLAEKMQKYSDVVVTAETIKAAKDDKATMNRLRTALEERRKEVKRDYLAPYMRFEAKYKELLALIDEPLNAIDTQIKTLDERERQAKYSRLKDYFAQCVDGKTDADPEIEFDRILNPKWQNKTMTEAKLQDEITAEVNRICGEYANLRQMYAQHPSLSAILLRYLEHYDRSEALAYAEQLRLKAMQDEELARKAKQEADAKAEAEFNHRREAAMKALAEQETHTAPETAHSGADAEPVQVNESTPEQPVQTVPAPSNDEKQYTGTFRVTTTKEKLIALRDFMKANGITFQIVK